MGPEELAIIMSPQFINATFRAGEDWYHSMVARNQEARRRNDFENANAELVRVNHLVISRSQEQNLRWKRYAETLDQRIEVLVRQVNARGEFGERVAGELDVASRNLEAKTTLCSQKDATIAQERQKVAALEAENEKLRAALSAAESDRQRLHEDNAAFLSAADHFEQKCKDLESDLERSQHALQEEEAQNLRLSEDFQNAHLVNEALLSASLSALPLMEQTRGLWAAQGKPSMMDNPLASHCRSDGQPLTVREYLWFATLMREMTAHNVPDHLVSTYCPVAHRGDFLTRPVTIQEKSHDPRDKT
ncbi:MULTISPECIES: hypothetical protein [Acetobacter]|uniref:hypothetical protein n=1 Tax=Acetobacter TaxID=434 RepID=UPI00376FF9D3